MRDKLIAAQVFGLLLVEASGVWTYGRDATRYPTGIRYDVLRGIWYTA
jgi:hypothetical protein